MRLDLLDERNGPRFDCGSGPPSRTLIIASTPRCGSTMFCRTLWETGCVGAPKEYFNPTQRRDWNVRQAKGGGRRVVYAMFRGPATGLLGGMPWSDRGLRAFTHGVQTHRTGSNGWFSTKIHWHHFRRTFVRPGRQPSAVFGPVAWVHMVREDRVAQAVSWARAVQTGRWAARQAEQRTPVYSRRLIGTMLRRIEEAEAGWSGWFASQDIEPVRVRYASYVEAHEAETLRVLNELGVKAPIDGIPALPTQVQRDEVNVRWCEQYRAAMP